MLLRCSLLSCCNCSCILAVFLWLFYQTLIESPLKLKQYSLDFLQTSNALRKQAKTCTLLSTQGAISRSGQKENSSLSHRRRRQFHEALDIYDLIYSIHWPRTCVSNAPCYRLRHLNFIETPEYFSLPDISPFIIHHHSLP